MHVLRIFVDDQLRGDRKRAGRLHISSPIGTRRASRPSWMIWIERLTTAMTPAAVVGEGLGFDTM